MDQKKTVNLRLKPDVHIRFLEVTDQKGYTMQSVLAAFVDAYIEEPERFTIKMEVSK